MSTLEVILLVCQAAGYHQAREVGCLEFYQTCLTHKYNIQVIDDMPLEERQKYCISQTAKNYMEKEQEEWVPLWK